MFYAWKMDFINILVLIGDIFYCEKGVVEGDWDNF